MCADAYGITINIGFNRKASMKKSAKTGKLIGMCSRNRKD